MLPKKALVFVVSAALLAALLSGCWGSRGNSSTGSTSGSQNSGMTGSTSGSLNGGMSGSMSGGTSSGMNGGISGSMNDGTNSGMNGGASGSGNLTDGSADSGMLGGADSGMGTGTDSGMLSGASGSMTTGGTSGSGSSGNAGASSGASSGAGAASGSSSGSGASSGSASANGTGAFSSGFAPAAATAAAPAPGDGEAWMTRLVNAQNPLPENFTVETARISGYDERLFDKRAASDLEALLADAEAAGCKLYLVSSYRSVERQAALFLRKTNSFLAEGFDQAEAERQAAMWVARPGTSEHNTGLAADLVSADWYTHHDDLTADFEETPEFAWLYEHCAEYGFILRYPRGKENITGVTYEPWHYRYVGKQAAAAIMQAGSTLEEYTEKESSPQAGGAGTGGTAGAGSAGTGGTATTPVTEPGFFTGW